MKSTERSIPGHTSRECSPGETQARHVGCSLVVLRVTESQVMGDYTQADVVRDELLCCYRHSGARHVIVDLGQVAFLTSAGIRSLLGLVPEVRERRGRLLLCNLRAEVEEVLLVTRLVGVNRGVPAPFEQHDNVPSAVASLYAATG